MNNNYDTNICDSLKQIWDDQLQFNKLILPCDPSEMSEEIRQHWINMYTLCLHREVDEALDETPFKPHRSGKPIIKSNVLEELIDIMKYWMCLSQVHGFNVEDVIDEYHRKSNVVKQRFFQEKIMKFDGKIVGIDIDGVLADYPRSFVEFINAKLNTYFDYREVKDYNISHALGLPPEECIRLKHLYRETGQKRFIPVIDGAKQFLDELKAMGLTIVLLTSRPYKEYKRIYGDTQYWLNENKLHYDAIMWDENKGERLIKEFGSDKIEFFVDDSAGFAKSISDVNIPCFLVTRPYNVGFEVSIKSNIVRVDDFDDILRTVRLWYA